MVELVFFFSVRGEIKVGGIVWGKVSTSYLVINSKVKRIIGKERENGM